jgi:hypothetical protein
MTPRLLAVGLVLLVVLVSLVSLLMSLLTALKVSTDVVTVGKSPNNGLRRVLCSTHQ